MTKPTREDIEARYGARATGGGAGPLFTSVEVPAPPASGLTFTGGAVALPKMKPGDVVEIRVVQGAELPPLRVTCVGGGGGIGGASSAPRLPNDEASDPWSRARAGSEAAARAWTPEQAAKVDAAIDACARSGLDFTADDVWGLAPGVPVTKGLAARLNAAVRRGVIVNTGQLSTAARGGEHDHAQRLTVWRGARP